MQTINKWCLSGTNCSVCYCLGILYSSMFKHKWICIEPLTKLCGVESYLKWLWKHSWIFRGKWTNGKGEHMSRVMGDKLWQPWSQWVRSTLCLLTELCPLVIEFPVELSAHTLTILHDTFWKIILFHMKYSMKLFPKGTLKINEIVTDMSGVAGIFLCLSDICKVYHINVLVIKFYTLVLHDSIEIIEITGRLYVLL